MLSILDSIFRYYNSVWRQSPGVGLTETSVHFIAALRMMAQALGLGEAKKVSALTSHVRQDLSSPDTVVGTVEFETGTAPATISISLASSQARHPRRNRVLLAFL